MAVRRYVHQRARSDKPATSSAVATAPDELEKPMTQTFKFPFAEVDFTKDVGRV